LTHNLDVNTFDGFIRGLRDRKITLCMRIRVELSRIAVSTCYPQKSPENEKVE